MNAQRVAGWFMIGVFLPIAAVFILAVSRDLIVPEDGLRVLATVGVSVVGVIWALRRITFQDRPPRPHTLFTPYYDQR